MIHLMFTYKVKEEKLDEVKQAIVDFVNAVEDNELQTSHYVSYSRQDDPLSFVHFMTFENDESRHIHEKAEYTKKFVDVLYPACENEPVFTDLTMIKCNKHL